MARLMLYFGGELCIGDEFTPTYIGGRNRPLLVDVDISLAMLKQRIMRALRINSTTNTVNLTCRFRDNGGYCATHVTDDEICEFMLLEGRTQIIIVYVEVEEILYADVGGPSTEVDM
ncbi:hypothetical protein M5K25_017686 [Dendrobium thyrsiflorum]|uniref:PB1 domain-containing protein n=1 Tax=Dendrobium thyrsiflorum TaxID=117978 RepID=A0ABD0UNE2_DENTH